MGGCDIDERVQACPPYIIQVYVYVCTQSMCGIYMYIYIYMNNKIFMSRDMTLFAPSLSDLNFLLAAHVTLVQRWVRLRTLKE